MNIHFIGIGGAGTAPLARIMLERGHRVSGSDQEASHKTHTLQKLGATIHTGAHHAGFLGDDTECVVYSSAVAPDNPELYKAQTLGIRTLRRGEFLAEFADSNRRLIAISGSHGKTSVTAMIAWILAQTCPEAGWLIGGEVPDFPMARAGTGDVFVTEVDESDGTHTRVHPWCGVVPNVDDDHSWSVGGEAQLLENFATFGKNSHHLVYVAHPRSEALYQTMPQAEAVQLTDADQAGLPPNLIGFQRLNGALARLACRLLGIGDEAIHAALKRFPGVERRLSLRFRTEHVTVIEDYAHHPTELAHCIATLHEMQPNAYLAIVFQPHRFARLEKYFDALAAELRKCDQVFLPPVFAAWSDKGQVDSADLARAVGPNAQALDGEWCDMAEKITRALPDGRPEILLGVIGAGDLNRLLDYLPDTLKSRSSQS